MENLIQVNTIAQVHEYFRLEKPKHPLVTVIQHSHETLQWDYGDVRFAVNLYQISYKGKLVGSMGYGRNSYDFHEGTMIFTSPGQVITQHDAEYQNEPESWSLIFHPDLIRKSELGKTIELYSFFSYDVNEALHISEEENHTITELANKIKKEYEQNIDKHTQKLIISNIELILDYCTRYYDRQFYTRTNLNKDIVSKFEHLLKNYFNSDNPLEMGIPSVRFCGAELNMSPNYLSDMLKKETGRNAQEHIHFYIVDRAKTRLLNSVESISQIAYGLGFEYPQHFSKLFKAKTGMSPAEYRSMN